MRFEAVLAQWENHEMSQAEAAHVLGVTERTFRRWCQRYEEDGLEGLLDRRIGKPSPKRVPPEWVARVAELYVERYQDFNAKHFHEHLVEEHNFP
jgi:transposase